MELTRHGLSNHRKKGSNDQKVCLKDQVRGSQAVDWQPLLTGGGQKRKQNKKLGSEGTRSQGKNYSLRAFLS